MLTDSHAHLTSFEENLVPPMLRKAFSLGVTKIVNIVTEAVELERGLKLVQDYPWVYNAAATTPHDVEKQGEIDFPLFEKAAKEGKLIAIGETGLDYHYTYSPRELQQHFLRKYMKLAQECKLPLIFHCRDAFADLFQIAGKEYQGRAVVHCFTGTLEEALEAVKRGWMISISGIVTFKKSFDLREVVKQISLEHLLIETDAPYLAPQTKRGEINEPGFILETAKCVAEIKGVSLEQLADATSRNAQRFFVI
jgi:TatD DNase family protein